MNQLARKFQKQTPEAQHEFGLYQKNGEYSAVYDRLTLNLPWYQQLLSRYVALATEILGPKQHEALHILDVGAGTGNISATLRESFRRSSFTLVELSEGMSNSALAKGFDKSEIYTCDMRNMAKVPSGSVDLVVSNNALYHLTKDELSESFAEFSRVLRVGGKMILSSPKPWNSSEQKLFFEKLSQQLLGMLARGHIQESELDAALSSNEALVSSMKSSFTNVELERFVTPFGFHQLYSDGLYDDLLYFAAFEKSSEEIVQLERETVLLAGDAYIATQNRKSIDYRFLPPEVKEAHNIFFNAFKAEARLEVTQIVAMERERMNPERITYLSHLANNVADGFTFLYDGSFPKKEYDCLPLEYFFPQLNELIRSDSSHVFEIKRAVALEEECSFADLRRISFDWMDRKFLTKFPRLFGHTISDKMTQFYIERHSARLVAGPELTGQAGHSIVEYLRTK